MKILSRNSCCLFSTMSNIHICIIIVHIVRPNIYLSPTHIFLLAASNNILHTLAPSLNQCAASHICCNKERAAVLSTHLPNHKSVRAPVHVYNVSGMTAMLHHVLSAILHTFIHCWGTTTAKTQQQHNCESSDSWPVHNEHKWRMKRFVIWCAQRQNKKFNN